MQGSEISVGSIGYPALLEQPTAGRFRPCLDRNDVLCPGPVNGDINFVDFDLPDTFCCCAKMTLEGIGCHAEEDVQKSIVSNLGKQRLFV